MAWTQADIDTLKAAIATGAKKVTFGAGPDQRTVEYRSLDEMQKILDRVQSEATGSPIGSPFTFARHTRE